MSENARRENRIQGIVDRVSSEDDFDSIKWITQAPVQTFCRSAVDETAQKNAELHRDLGIQAKIVRTMTGKENCKWCEGLAGEYEYPDVPENVFHRHDDCDCVVEYQPGDGMTQDVWSKEWYETSDELKEARAELDDLKLKTRAKGKALEKKITDSEAAKKQADQLFFVQSAKSVEDLDNILASLGYQFTEEQLHLELPALRNMVAQTIKEGKKSLENMFDKLDKTHL